MFTDSYRFTPRKLIELTEYNPKALWLYCYLVDKMDDRVEMTCNLNVCREHKGMGMTRASAQRAVNFLVNIGAITMTSSRNGYKISAVNYPNHSRIKSESKANQKLNQKLNQNIQPEDTDIFGVIDDIETMRESTFESTSESCFESYPNHGTSVLYSGKKERKKKEKKSTSSLSTAGVDSADSQDDGKPDWLAIVEHWNEQLPTHQKVIVGILRKNEKRKKAINAIISNVGMDMLFDTIKSISKSEFCNGKNDRNWKPDFDWILDVKNVQKVLENKYIDKQEKVVKEEKQEIIEEYVPKISWEERINKLYGR